MRFSFWPNAGQPWSEILDVAGYAERTGWDGIWIADHFMPIGGDLDMPMHECFSVLAALAVAVPRVRLGCARRRQHLPAPGRAGQAGRHHRPRRRAAASCFGIGAGWQENEHDAYGIELRSIKGRLDRFEEACHDHHVAPERGAHHASRASYYTVTDAPLDPKPAAGHLPVLVGGGGEKRTMRIAAQYADEWNVWGDPALLAPKSAVLDRHCEDLGRDPASITRSANALLFLSEDEAWVASGAAATSVGRRSSAPPAEVVDIVAAYVDAGVDELIIPDFNLRDPQCKRETMDLFMEQRRRRGPGGLSGEFGRWPHGVAVAHGNILWLGSR